MRCKIRDKGITYGHNLWTWLWARVSSPQPWKRQSSLLPTEARKPGSEVPAMVDITFGTPLSARTKITKRDWEARERSAVNIGIIWQREWRFRRTVPPRHRRSHGPARSWEVRPRCMSTHVNVVRFNLSASRGVQRTREFISCCGRHDWCMYMRLAAFTGVAGPENCGVGSGAGRRSAPTTTASSVILSRLASAAPFSFFFLSRLAPTELALAMLLATVSHSTAPPLAISLPRTRFRRLQVHVYILLSTPHYRRSYPPP